METKEIAILAGGCFWGVEHFMNKIEGVLSVESGYIGGELDAPSYNDVKGGTTGHAEAVRVIFDSSRVDFETILRQFFEIHDPEQTDRQGVDIGTQYRSEIFYTNDTQKEISQKIIQLLRDRGYNIATKLSKATTFYVAEQYHQAYTTKHNIKEPECHRYVKRF